MEQCFLCGKAVVGLRGESDVLDTAIIDSTDEALSAEAWGPCHSKCLSLSPWGSKWGGYRLRRRQASSAVMTRIFDPELTVQFNRNNRDVMIMRADGVRWTFGDRDARTVVPEGKQGWSIPLEGEFNLALCNFTPAVVEIQDCLRKKGTYPLTTLIHTLGIEDKILFPLALVGGELHFRSELTQFWTESSISVHITYNCFVPFDIYSAWMTTRDENKALTTFI